MCVEQQNPNANHGNIYVYQVLPYIIVLVGRSFFFAFVLKGVLDDDIDFF